jgi:hypothetical protein
LNYFSFVCNKKGEFIRLPGTAPIHHRAMKAPVQVQERIIRVWSSRKKDDFAVRLRYTIAESNGCRVYTITGREEWD